MSIYTIDKKYIENITDIQKEDMISSMTQKQNGDITVDYNHKGYKCNKQTDYSTNIQAISLFSGAGGLDIGAQLAGVRVISSHDIFSDSVNTLKQNKYFKHTIHECGDIHDLKGKHYSQLIKKQKPDKLIVIGGPPCQPFSKAGYWVKNVNRDPINDPRNLIEPYFRLLRELQPDGFVLENVESILHPTNKQAVDTILDKMKSLKYNFTILKLNAADYGLPQKRKRVFFLASKKEINAQLTKTRGTEKECKINSTLKPYEPVINWIGKFDNDQYNRNQNLETTGKWEHELKCIPFGKNYIALTEKAGYPDPVFIAGKRYWSSLLKLHPLLPSWTIIASPGHWEGPFHWKNRRLNIRELAAIQTFPDDYLFYGSAISCHKQIGNAVPPMLAKIVVEELIKWI